MEMNLDNYYVFLHKWGSFESDETVNKLLLTNKAGFDVYIRTVLSSLFRAKFTNNTLEFENGEVYKININYH